MKAVVLTGIRRLELPDVPAPQIRQPHEVLVRAGRVGIRGSGRWRRTAPGG